MTKGLFSERTRRRYKIKGTMNIDEIIEWLLKGDVSIQYQTYRDLLNEERKELKERIAHEGWGKQFLSCRGSNGHWGQSFYQPKWTSTHYTLLDLKNLCIANCKPIRQTIKMILNEEKGADGGINPSRTIGNSDVCINGMALNYCCYFGADEADLQSIVDFVLSQWMADGGFNCRSNRSGARHSSLHTTLSVLEGIWEYEQNGYTYRLQDLRHAAKVSKEFILLHKLYKSDKTGEIIDKKMLAITYPPRWRYDILRALDYFQMAGEPYDKRMQDAIEVIVSKRNEDGTWNQQARHPGQVHFQMETAGKSSRWNTLRALKVLRHFGMEK
ncbi:hypothetical protein C900_05039 [Fulvivirga imtechensis AK7]|uniref:Squalene cyclase C-terminal domain-containing protein n=2 Tax=Fulvivirga TaxID=396811 RepID=L8JQ48_9BACT|nr:hypothetical protein C900_05039 [Fulvivirga imtechensis AK7]